MSDFEALFNEHLPFIRRTAAAASRRLGFRGADADEFGSDVEVRIWQGDYAILRKWRGESKLTTYLTIVIANLGREYRVQHWGRWRPAAAARRLGPLAIELETLVHRDGLPLAQAGEFLRTSGATSLSDRDLAALLAQIPSLQRPLRGTDQEVSREPVVDGASADDLVVKQERRAARRRVTDALDAALATLAPLAQLVIRMFYFDGLQISQIARALNTDQRPLYREKNRAVAVLLRRLMAAGITDDDVRDLFGDDLGDDIEDDTDPPDGDDDRPGTVPRRPTGGNTAGPRPSNETCDSNLTDRDEALGSSDVAAPERSVP